SFFRIGDFVYVPHYLPTGNQNIYLKSKDESGRWKISLAIAMWISYCCQLFLWGI
ncbi:hypothetical protein SOVF_195950, partial [Spinacia oleracea]